MDTGADQRSVRSATNRATARRRAKALLLVLGLLLAAIAGTHPAAAQASRVIVFKVPEALKGVLRIQSVQRLGAAEARLIAASSARGSQLVVGARDASLIRRFVRTEPTTGFGPQVRGTFAQTQLAFPSSGDTPKVLYGLERAGARAVLADAEAARGLSPAARPLVLFDDAVANAKVDWSALTDDTLILAENTGSVRRALQLSKDKLVLLRRSDNALIGLAALEQRVRAIRVFHNVPANLAEARAIHGKAVERVGPEYLTALRSRLDTFSRKSGMLVRDIGDVLPNRTVAETLRAELASGKSGELRIVIAHVTKGSAAFHDGSGMLLSELSKYPNTWLLGCNTVEQLPALPGLRLGTFRNLSYDEALAALGAAADVRALALGPPTQAGLLRQIQRRFPEMAVGVVSPIAFIQAAGGEKLGPRSG